MTYDPPFLPACPERAKGNNRADRIRITSDRFHVKFALDTPDDWVGHVGECLIVDEDDCHLIFGSPKVNAQDVIIDPLIPPFTGDNVYDVLVEIASGGIGDDQTAAEVPIDPITELPGVTEVQTALEQLAEISTQQFGPTNISPSDTINIDSVTTTDPLTLEWTVSVENPTTGEYSTSKVLAVYDGNTELSHTRYAILGDKHMDYEINVQLVSPNTVALVVDNNETNSINVTANRFPFLILV